MKSDTTDFTRRGFIGLAGAAVATTAAASLLSACSTQERLSVDGSDGSDASPSRESGIEAPGSGTPNADGNYNILLITTDQEHYFSEYPEDTRFAARKLLEELGCTFEKHYPVPTCRHRAARSCTPVLT